MKYFIICGILIALVIFSYVSNNHIATSVFQVDLGADAPFRIVQLSDLHSKQFGKNNKVLYEKISEQSPDIIVFTGDLIDDSAVRIDETVDFVGRLGEIAPVYYIYGNHEHRTKHYDYIGDRLKSRGVTVLKNEIAYASVKENDIAILGLDENQAAKKNYKERKNGTFVYEDNSEYFHELQKHEGIKIVLSHFPENFESDSGYTYKNYNYDLQFSGHAHGGQFRLPFIGGVFAPGQGINPRFYQGIHGSGPYMIVSRGLGNSGFPQRLFNCPNLVVADIH